MLKVILAAAFLAAVTIPATAGQPEQTLGMGFKHRTHTNELEDFDRNGRTGKLHNSQDVGDSFRHRHSKSVGQDGTAKIRDRSAIFDRWGNLRSRRGDTDSPLPRDRRSHRQHSPILIVR